MALLQTVTELAVNIWNVAANLVKPHMPFLPSYLMFISTAWVAVVLSAVILRSASVMVNFTDYLLHLMLPDFFKTQLDDMLGFDDDIGLSLDTDSINDDHTVMDIDDTVSKSSDFSTHSQVDVVPSQQHAFVQTDAYIRPESPSPSTPESLRSSQVGDKVTPPKQPYHEQPKHPQSYRQVAIKNRSIDSGTKLLLNNEIGRADAVMRSTAKPRQDFVENGQNQQLQNRTHHGGRVYLRHPAFHETTQQRPVQNTIGTFNTGQAYLPRGATYESPDQRHIRHAASQELHNNNRQQRSELRAHERAVKHQPAFHPLPAIRDSRRLQTAQSKQEERIRQAAAWARKHRI